MGKYTRHFFVCAAQRPPMGKPSCGAQRSAEILLKLQEGLAEHPELWDSVNVTSSGCLGTCFDGPSVVVYPEGTWYAKVTLEDVEEIVASHMLGGRPVGRLLYQWPAP